MAFSRSRGNKDRADDARRGGRGAATEPEVDADLVAPKVTAAERGFGPYDAGDKIKDGTERLDLGALRLPAVPGVEIQLQASPQGQIQQLQLVHDASRMQLAAYAAPRSEGIWEEIREILWTSLIANGAKPEEVEGDYGIEVRARVRDESGATAIVRHVGIDGPRWFVHAIMFGAAAADPDASAPLLTVLRGTVVDRGTEARPVKEMLPLRLPANAAAQLAAQAGADGQAGGTNGARANGAGPGAARPAGAGGNDGQGNDARGNDARTNGARANGARANGARANGARRTGQA